MKHVAYIAWVFPLVLWGCEPPQLLVADGGIGNRPSTGGQGGTGGTAGEPGDGGGKMVGGTDGDGGAIPLGGQPDMGGEGAAGMEMGGTLLVDPIEPGVPDCEIPARDLYFPAGDPEYGQATAVYDGADIHLLWYEATCPVGQNRLDGACHTLCQSDEDCAAGICTLENLDQSCEDDAGEPCRWCTAPVDSGAVGAPGVYQCTLGADGLFRGAAEPIRDLEGQADEIQGVERVVSARVRGVPWVAYGGGDHPIRLFQAHRVDQTFFPLDGLDGRPHLVGPPLVVAAGRDLMVFGRTPSLMGEGGDPAWVRIGSDLSVSDEVISVPMLSLPQFDDVVVVRGGLLARAEDLGQCVYIGAAHWLPLSNFYCRFQSGGLITDGDIPHLWSRFDQGAGDTASQSVGVWPIYSFEETTSDFFEVVGLENEDLLQFPRYNGLQPIVGRRTHTLTDLDAFLSQTELSFIGVDEWWSSNPEVPWVNLMAGDNTGWPYSRARALATHHPTAESCPVEQGCIPDTLNAVIFLHQARGPTVQYTPLVQRTVEGSLYDLASNPLCSPIPETCDGLDNDCDGRIDDGLCCLGEPVAQFDFPEEVKELADHEIGSVTQWRITTNSTGDEYWVVYRSADPEPVDGEAPQSWDGFKYKISNPEQSLPFGTRDPDGNLPFAHFGSEPNDVSPTQSTQAVFAAGGKSAVLLSDDRGGLKLAWGSTGQGVKPPQDLPSACWDYLAVGVLRSDDVPEHENENRESLFLVCRDRIVRYYSSPVYSDLTYYWGATCPDGCDENSQALGVVPADGDIQWATVTQVPVRPDPINQSPTVVWGTQFYLTIGYLQGQTPEIQVYQVDYAQDTRCDGEDPLEPRLPCHRPQIRSPEPQDFLIDPGGLYARDNYPHPIWASSKQLVHLQSSSVAQGVRRVPGVAANGALDRLELAFQGKKNADAVLPVEWRPLSYGPLPDDVRFFPMSGRVIVVDRENDQTRFWALDTMGDDGIFTLWAMHPVDTLGAAFYGDDEIGASGQPTWAYVEGPTGTLEDPGKKALNTFVEFRPRVVVEGTPVAPTSLAEGDLTLNGVAIRAPEPDDFPIPPVEGDVVASARAVMAVINDATEQTGISAGPLPTRVEGGVVEAGELTNLQINGIRIYIGGPSAQGRPQDVPQDDADERLMDAINHDEIVPLTGVRAERVELEDMYGLVLTAADGRNIRISLGEDDAVVTGLTAGVTHGSLKLSLPSPPFEELTVGGDNPGAAGLTAGTFTSDGRHWRITARRLDCGGN